MAKIFSVFGRAGLARVFDPLARVLLRAGVSPNAVTLAGTAGIVIIAVLLAAPGHLVAASLSITVLAFTDMVDGSMARQSHRRGNFGAFLDSTMDRVSDGAVFGAVIYWLGTQHRHTAAAAGLICLVSGQVIPYTKARAASLGMSADVGIAERAERLVIVGVGGLLTGLGVHYAIDVALWLLVAVSLVTIVQRMSTVYRQDRVAFPDPGAGPEQSPGADQGPDGSPGGPTALRQDRAATR